MTKPSGTPKCGADKKQGQAGETCGQAAGWGTDHPGTGRCKLHGGSTPTQRQAAHEQRLEHAARGVLAQLDVAPVSDPFAALALLAGQAVTWQQAISGIVNRLGADTIRYEAMGAGTEQLRAEIALYERAMDRTGHVLASIAKLNIDERMSRINERVAEQVIDAINAVLGHLGVTGEQAVEARQIAARHLRAVPD